MDEDSTRTPDGDTGAAGPEPVPGAPVVTPAGTEHAEVIVDCTTGAVVLVPAVRARTRRGA